MPIQLTSDPNYTMLAIGGSDTFQAEYSNIDIYNLIPDGGAITLSAPLTLGHTGTPAENQVFTFSYGGGVTLNGNALTIFGYVLSINEALTPTKFEFQFLNGAFVLRRYDVDNGTDKYIDGASLYENSIPNSAIPSNTITVGKLANSTRGYLIRGATSGIHQEFAASTAGAVVQGDGVDAVSIVPSGDVFNDAAGVRTIQPLVVTGAKMANATITVGKCVATVNTEVLTVAASFETDEQGGGYKVKLPYACSVLDVYASATKAIAATDSGTVILRDDAGTTMTVASPIVFAASDAIGTAYSSAVTANNVFAANEILTVETAKATAGGKVLVSLTVLRS